MVKNELNDISMCAQKMASSVDEGEHRERPLTNDANLMDIFSVDQKAVDISDQDEHWHFVTCGVIAGSGGC